MGRTRGDKKREEENTSIIFLTIEGFWREFLAVFLKYL